MDHTVNIPTAEQARAAVQKQAEIDCEKVWNDIMYAVRNSINEAIRNCKCSAYLTEASMHGVPTKSVYHKLLPILEDMGYRVMLGTYAGIVISWAKDDENESK